MIQIAQDISSGVNYFVIVQKRSRREAKVCRAMLYGEAFVIGFSNWISKK